MKGSTFKIKLEHLGSGTHLTHAIRKYGKENFKKEILEYYNSREELNNAEIKLLTKDIIQDKLCMNINFGGNAGLLGKIVVKDKDNTYFSIFNDDPRYLSGELVGFSKGKVNVKDKNGKYFSVFVDDPRYLSGELIPVSKGLVAVKDINNKIYSINKDDPRYLSGELISTTVGKVSVKDKNGKGIQIDKNDSRYLSGELVGCSKNTITVKDKNGIFSKVNIDNEKYLNGELVHMWKDKKHSEESKKKMSESSKGKAKGELNGSFGTCWITKDSENKKIKKEELEYYLSLNWIKGRKFLQ